MGTTNPLVSKYDKDGSFISISNDCMEGYISILIDKRQLELEHCVLEKEYDQESSYVKLHIPEGVISHAVFNKLFNGRIINYFEDDQICKKCGKQVSVYAKEDGFICLDCFELL